MVETQKISTTKSLRLLNQTGVLPASDFFIEIDNSDGVSNSELKYSRQLHFDFTIFNSVKLSICIDPDRNNKHIPIQYLGGDRYCLTFIDWDNAFKIFFFRVNPINRVALNVTDEKKITVFRANDLARNQMLKTKIKILSTSKIMIFNAEIAIYQYWDSEKRQPTNELVSDKDKQCRDDKNSELAQTEENLPSEKNGSSGFSFWSLFYVKQNASGVANEEAELKQNPASKFCNIL